jgi:hypothetical protein
MPLVDLKIQDWHRIEKERKLPDVFLNLPDMAGQVNIKRDT